MSIYGPIYNENEKYDRLRVMGVFVSETGYNQITFIPFKQVRLPNDDPYADHMFTINYLCDVVYPWFRCNMLTIQPEKLGQYLKYLLRQSNTSFSSTLANQAYPDDLKSLEIVPSFNRTLDAPHTWNIFFHLEAYDNQIVIPFSGTHNPYSPYLPKDHVDMSTIRVFGRAPNKRYSAKGKDIVLPDTIDNKIFGTQVWRVWATESDLPDPPLPEYREFVERIMY